MAAKDQPVQLPNASKFYSDASRIGSKEKSVGWYVQSFPGTPEDTRELLESYARLHPDEVDSHVLAIVSSYSCFKNPHSTMPDASKLATHTFLSTLPSIQGI